MRSHSAMARVVLLALSLHCLSADAVTVLSGDAALQDGNLFIAGSTAGSATVTAPGPDSFVHIAIGGDPARTGVGSMTVSGAGAVVDVANIVQVGAQSSGSLTVGAGAKVHSRGGESPFCTGCNSTEIANGGGSSGVLTVTGAGSEFTAGDELGNAVFFVANGGVSPGFGTAGTATFGHFKILDGATATTTGTVIAASRMAGDDSYTGQSQSTGIVDVIGTGSRWTVQQPARGLVAFVDVGGRGTGTVNVKEGGRFDATFLHMGVDAGSQGSLVVDGAGSFVSLAGGNAVDGGAGFIVGWRAGSTGSVEVTGGGHVRIDARGDGAPGGFVLGGLHTAAGGNGTMLVSGSGSLVEIMGNAPAVSPAGFTVGLTGQGQLSVLEGGRIEVTDSSPEAFGAFSIGGNGAQAQAGIPAGHGKMLVSGAGSEVAILSAHGNFVVGHTQGSTGLVTVEAGGRISAPSGFIGRDAGSVGTLSLQGEGSALALAGDAFGYGAFLVVGYAGTGTLIVQDKALLDMKPTADVLYGGMAIGGSDTQDAAEQGGTGVVTVTTGGKIVLAGDSSTHIMVGLHPGGHGTLNVTQGGRVDIAPPLDPASPQDISGLYVAPVAGATGTMVVDGENSVADAGIFLGIGMGQDKTGAGGSGVVSVRNGGRVVADLLRIGDSGILSGNGIIEAAVESNGVIAPGNSPGVMTIVGSLVSTGTIVIEVAGLGAGEHDVLDVSGDVDLNGATVRFVFLEGFRPHAGDRFDFLAAPNAVAPLSGTSFTYQGVGAGFEFQVDAASGEFTALNDAVPVPEPSTWALLGAGAAGLAWRVRKAKGICAARG